jgi:hypothetical protein
VPTARLIPKGLPGSVIVIVLTLAPSRDEKFPIFTVPVMMISVHVSHAGPSSADGGHDNINRP